MNILRSYKRTRFFLWVNITGLAIGLAVSIMLILFVVNELSYDKHFENKERIVRLITVWEGKDQATNYAINMRKAYTELPAKIPGVEAAVQFYQRGGAEVIHDQERFQNVRTLCVDSEFFKVFQMKFVEGNAQTALANTHSVVLARRQADIIFGDSHSAINQTVKVNEQDYTVSAVVENLPANTHFTFDALANMQSINHWMEYMPGLEFQTYYLIRPDASLNDVRTAIEKEYSVLTAAFGESFNAKIYGKTDKLTDIYLHSDGFSGNIGKMGSMRLVCNYLKNIPIGYNPENVVTIPLNSTTYNSFEAIKQELLSVPEIKQVSGAQHIFGIGGSGQRISPLDNKEGNQNINEYRIMPGICELMEIQLLEGSFFKENAPDSVEQVVLNESAVKMLGLSSPVVGQSVIYKGNITEIVGIAKDFCYADPADKIAPIALSKVNEAGLIYIRFREGTDRRQALEKTLEVFHQFEPDFIANPVWSEDIYTRKFETLTTTSKVITVASLLSIFIAMLGLVAIHLYTTVRRTKEIGIRRINGAGSQAIFTLLTGDIVKWIVVAGIVAAPIIYYLASNMLNQYSNHTSLSWSMFLFPIFIQCVIAILATSGVTLWALQQNPVNALKKE